MKKRGHYCKVCGEYKANEKFSGKGHAAHICKTCAALPPEKQAEEVTLTRLVNLPWRLSKEQLSWLKKRMILAVPQSSLSYNSHAFSNPKYG